MFECCCWFAVVVVGVYLFFALFLPVVLVVVGLCLVLSRHAYLWLFACVGYCWFVLVVVVVFVFVVVGRDCWCCWCLLLDCACRCWFVFVVVGCVFCWFVCVSVCL